MEDQEIIKNPNLRSVSAGDPKKYIPHEMREPQKRHKNICFVAGRSGGHIVPCLTRAAQIKKRYPHFTLSLFTTRHVLDMNIARQSTVPIAHIPLSLGEVPGKNPFKIIFFLMQLLYAFIKSAIILKRNRISHVVTTGSYIAIPVCLAAWILKIPIELHVLDIAPGKALRFLAPFAQSISLCFAESEKYFPKHKCYATSYPIRFEKPQFRSTSIGCPTENTISKKFTLLILGGSQGSDYVNRLVQEWVKKYGVHIKKRLHIIHQTGALKDSDVASFYKEHGINAIVFDYKNDLEHCLATADLVICRSGAGTLFEIDFFKIPCITIPLVTKTTAHQVDNARSFAARFPERFMHLEQKEDVKLMSEQLNQTIQKW